MTKRRHRDCENYVAAISRRHQHSPRHQCVQKIRNGAREHGYRFHPPALHFSGANYCGVKVTLDVDCSRESERLVVGNHPKQATFPAPKKHAITQIIYYLIGMLDWARVYDQTKDIINATINLRCVFDLVMQINNRASSHSHYQNDLRAQSFNQLMIQTTPVGIIGGGEQALYYG